MQTFFSFVRTVLPTRAYEHLLGENENGFAKYFKNAGWMLFAQVAYLATSFFSTIVVARMLGPESYGELSYAMSFVALFSTVVGIGSITILYRELVRKPEEKATYLGTTFVITLASGLAAQLATLLVAIMFSPHDVSLWAIILLSFGFYGNAFWIISYEFWAEAKSKWPSVVNAVAHFAAALLKIGAVLLGYGVLYLAAIIVFEAALQGLGLLYFRIRQYGSLLQWRYDHGVACRLLQDSWPLVVVSSFTLIYTRVDQVMIKNMVDAQAVGLYDAAARLSELWHFIPTLIIAALFPAIVNADTHSEKLLVSRTRSLAAFLVGIAVVISIAVTLSSDILIAIVFGTEFASASPVLRIYVWSFIAISLGLLLNQYLVVKNKQRVIIGMTFLGAAANIILNLALIPSYGIVGAAWATFVSYFVPLMAWVLWHTCTQARSPASSV